MYHTIDEHPVGVACVHLLGPGATLIILGRIPEGADSFLHQEEHPGIPGIQGDGFHYRPEFGRRCKLEELDVALE